MLLGQVIAKAGGNALGLGVKPEAALALHHGRAVQTAFDGDGHAIMLTGQRLDGGNHLRRLLGLGHPEIHPAAGIGRDDIGARAAPDRRHIGGDPALQIGHGMNCQDNPGQRHHGAAPLGPIAAGMGTFALGGDGEAASAFACRDHAAIGAAGGFGDQHGGGARRLGLDDGAAGGAAHLLIGGEQQGDWPIGGHPLAQNFPHRMKGQEAAGLHVIDPGPIGAVALDAKRHVLEQLPMIPHGIEMA